MNLIDASRDELIRWLFSPRGRVRWQVKLAAFAAPAVLFLLKGGGAWFTGPYSREDFYLPAAAFGLGLALMSVTIVHLHLWRCRVARPLLSARTDWAVSGEVTYLYRYYGIYGRDADYLLYVGITNHITRRAGQHEEDKAWFSAVRRSTIQSYPSREAALEAERLAIKVEHPVHNIAHNGARPARTGRAKSKGEAA